MNKQGILFLIIVLFEKVMISVLFLFVFSVLPGQNRSVLKAGEEKGRLFKFPL